MAKKTSPWARQHCSNAALAYGVMVYVLWCPVAKQIKYVGCSGYTPQARLLGHVCEARTKSAPLKPKNLWIQGLLAKGLYPTLRFIKGFNYYEEAYILEAELIAAIGIRRNLVNGNHGNVRKAALYADHFKA